MATIKDVAHAAGVSTATVSRALSNKPYVRAEIRERVLQAVADLDYQMNMAARNLRSNQSNTIGLIVSDIRNPYFTAVSRAVEDSAYEAGLHVFLCNTDEQVDKEAIYLGIMAAENVSGVIFSPTATSATRFSTLNLDRPAVVIDRVAQSDRVDMVLIDNVQAGYQLTEHLIQNGYKRIGGIFSKMNITGQQRYEGFEAALKAHGLESAHTAYVDAKGESGMEATLAMTATPDTVDAIVTTNSLLTAGAFRALRERGLKIPQDVALAGFDDTEWSTLVQPSITVIAQPTYEIGRTATELLLQRIAEPDRPARKVILQGRLVVRDSTAPRLVPYAQRQ
jgi:LacI family fructose operon transcriptional repressor